MICTKCKKPIAKYEDYPGNYCLACHEARFNANNELQNTTAESLASQFKNLIK